MVQPSTVNGTDLGAREWRDAAFLRYGLEPPDLPKYCDGCNARFSICHALDCKRYGLVMARHNELCDGVADLAGKAFTPSHVCNNPLIYQGCAVKRTETKPAGTSDTTDPEDTSQDATEQNGDLLLRDLWQNGTESVHDMRDWTLMLSPIRRSLLRNVWRGRRRVRRRCTWIVASSSADTSRHL